MNLEIISSVTNIITSLSVLLAIVQFTKEMRAQNVQSFFYLHGYLSNDTLNAARKLVRTELFKKEYKSWTDEDKGAANQVCASYDQAGILLSSGVIDRRTKGLFLASSWGNSIIHQYESLKDFLDDRQAPKCEECEHETPNCDSLKCTGRAFFTHFTWLYEESKAIKGNKVFVAK